jgi:integrase
VKGYFRLIEPGLHLGYRKRTGGPGTWLARRYIGNGRYSVDNLRTAAGALIIADDFDSADGERVLTFAQAQQKAKGPRSTAPGAYTVGEALADYFRYLESDGRSKRSIADARTRSAALIEPTLGSVKAGALTAETLRQWRDGLAKAPARLRTRPGEKQQHRETADSDDARRARRATANRTWTVLRAALNHAYRDGKIASDEAWRKVKPYRSVDRARIRYLTIAEAKRLINACEPEFRTLVEAALQTGARYGELAALTVGDFNGDVGTVRVGRSKSGQARHIVLTGEGRAFFRQLTTGRAGAELMLSRQWLPSQQARPMAAAVHRARISPAISFHGLRHTWASLAVMAGMPLMVIAKNLGHRDTRMVEKHYGHLAPSYVADAIEKSAPRFGFKPSRKVSAI